GYEEWTQPIEQIGEDLEGGGGLVELAAGSHRLEQGGGLCGLWRESREEAAQFMGRFPQVGRVSPHDGLPDSGQATRYVVPEDTDHLIQEHRIVVAGREQRIRVDDGSRLCGRGEWCL